MLPVIRGGSPLSAGRARHKSVEGAVNVALVATYDQAAMRQERARTLEAQVEQLLTLPLHEEAPEAPDRRWAFWRHG